jgi:hypothetical protein
MCAGCAWPADKQTWAHGVCGLPSAGRAQLHGTVSGFLFTECLDSYPIHPLFSSETTSVSPEPLYASDGPQDCGTVAEKSLRIRVNMGRCQVSSSPSRSIQALGEESLGSSHRCDVLRRKQSAPLRRKTRALMPRRRIGHADDRDADCTGRYLRLGRPAGCFDSQATEPWLGAAGIGPCVGRLRPRLGRHRQPACSGSSGAIQARVRVRSRIRPLHDKPHPEPPPVRSGHDGRRSPVHCLKGGRVL